MIIAIGTIAFILTSQIRPKIPPPEKVSGVSVKYFSAFSGICCTDSTKLDAVLLAILWKRSANQSSILKIDAITSAP